MRLRNRMISDGPRIEEPAGDEVPTSQEDTSSTAPQVGSPISTRTRSISASDSQQAALAASQESVPSPERGQHTQYSGLDPHEDFILYSHSDTDDGTEEQVNAFLSPHTPQRIYRRLAPRTDMTQTQAASSSSGPSGIHPMDYGQQAMTPQRQQPPMHIQLPTPSQTDNMMPHFEQNAGPWSPNSPINPESRKRALSDEIPGINEYPKDRHWNDKMQDALNEIEKRPEGQEDSEEGRRRSKQRRKSRKDVSTPSSKSMRKDDKHGKDNDEQGDGQGGGQAVMAS